MDTLARIARKRGPRTIAANELPELVTFTDVNDPNTVTEVDPNNLEATLGPGVSWNEITLEVTDEPITKGDRRKVGLDTTLLLLHARWCAIHAQEHARQQLEYGRPHSIRSSDEKDIGWYRPRSGVLEELESVAAAPSLARQSRNSVAAHELTNRRTASEALHSSRHGGNAAPTGMNKVACSR